MGFEISYLRFQRGGEWHMGNGDSNYEDENEEEFTGCRFELM